MSSAVSSPLLLEIARCRHASTCIEEPSRKHHCSEIVAVQRASLETFQLPEPWSGNLEHARVLFLGSNPGYAPREEYPTWSWPDEEITDFFTHRFGGGSRKWVEDELRPLVRAESTTEDGYKRNWVRYWAAVRSRAAELYGRRDVRPGVDYDMSEVVHCKSAREIGVRSALEECVPLYLGRLVAASGARLVVCLGAIAADVVGQTWSRTARSNVHGPVVVGDRERYFVFLPHPNARGDRSVWKCLSPDEIQRLQRILAD